MRERGPSFRRRRRRVPRIGFIRRICFPSERFSETIRFPAEPVPGQWRSEAPFAKLDQVYSSIDQSNLSKEPSHDTAAPTHDRRYAIAQRRLGVTDRLLRVARGSHLAESPTRRSARLPGQTDPVPTLGRAPPGLGHTLAVNKFSCIF